MWSGAWNKRKLTSEISNRFLASSVGRAGDWWSEGHWFKPQWGQFLTKFILFCVASDLSDNLTEMHQSGLSWKTWLFYILRHRFGGFLPPVYVVWQEGNVLTPVCVSVHRGRSQVQVQVGGVPGLRSRWGEFQVQVGAYLVSGLGAGSQVQVQMGGVTQSQV